MKSEIHPNYTETKVVCNCGNEFSTRSTIASEQLNIEICSKCHPFFTGQQRIVDTAGRVDRFRQKYQKKATKPAENENQANS